MPLLGAHLSIAGGYYKAVEAAARYGMDTVQVFTANARQWPKAQTPLQSGGFYTKNNNQWRAKPISAEDVALFRTALAEKKIVQPIAHASYLINLASGNETLWEKSVDGMVVELQRASQSPGYAKADAWIYLGEALVQTKRYKEAVEALEKALTIAPESAQATAALAWAYFGLKDAANFKRIAGKARSLGYKEPTLLDYLGRVEAGQPIK